MNSALDEAVSLPGEPVLDEIGRLRIREADERGRELHRGFERKIRDLGLGRHSTDRNGFRGAMAGVTCEKPLARGWERISFVSISSRRVGPLLFFVFF